MITTTVIIPGALWIRAGAPGIPVLPVIAGLYFPYFAVPILRENFGQALYAPTEVLQAAETVALFLFTATLTWALIARRKSRTKGRPAEEFATGQQVVALAFAGLSIGIGFQLATISGLLGWLGSAFGLVRSVALAGTSIGCYLLGHCRASGLLRGRRWAWSLVGLATIVILSWSSIYLYLGMTFALAALLGYAITSKKIPWKSLAAGAIILFVLHAGKSAMRDKHWIQGYEQSTSIIQLPGEMVDWLSTGIAAINSGNGEQDIVDRASLLSLLLRVQTMTPNFVPFLEGGTYKLLPNYLIPRFVDANKTYSQAGLRLLSTRYGLQSDDNASDTTTIGWGLVAEAYANFGFVGVLCAGALLGMLTAVFSRLSNGKSALALPTLVSVAALVTMTNLEADLAYLLTTLWQALAATTIFFLPVKYLIKPRAAGVSRFSTVVNVR